MCHPEVPAGQQAPEVKHENVRIPVPGGGEEMEAFLAHPDGPSAGAVLIVNDIFGKSPFYENLAARLATAGFTAICPEYFFRQGALPERTIEHASGRRKKLDEQQTLRDFNAALDWLKKERGAERLGTIGFCMGGTLVLDLAAQRSDLATVCFYGFPAGAPNASANPAPAPLSVADQIHGPILAFWGDQDTGVGMDNVQALVQKMQERRVEFDHTIFPGLGHGFLAASGLDPNHAAYEKACQAWTRTVEFYRQQLGAAVGASS